MEYYSLFLSKSCGVSPRGTISLEACLLYHIAQKSFPHYAQNSAIRTSRPSLPASATTMKVFRMNNCSYASRNCLLRVTRRASSNFGCRRTIFFPSLFATCQVSIYGISNNVSTKSSPSFDVRRLLLTFTSRDSSFQKKCRSFRKNFLHRGGISHDKSTTWLRAFRALMIADISYRSLSIKQM